MIVDSNALSCSFLDSKENKLLLGDFNKLVDFVITNSGRKEQIEVIANG